MILMTDRVSSASIDQSKLFILFLVLAILISSTQVIRHKTQNSKTPVYSLSLHPLESIIKHQNHKNLTARTISMLAADSTRLKYINSKLRKSNFQALVTASPGGYVARIGVGTPVKEYYLVVDTGSDVTWLQCNPCKKCDPQSEPIFDPIKSSSYDLLSCYSEECDKIPGQTEMCNDYGNCIYKLKYDDGSTSEGEYALEMVSFGMSSRIEDVAIGCGNNNQGTFKDFAGIMGLSWSEASFPSQIAATSFSYCLVDPHYSVDKSSTLDFNTLLDDPNMINIPLFRNTVISEIYYYYLKITGITVGQNYIMVPPSVYEINRVDGTGGIIIDSGTSMTYLDPVVYNKVRDAFKKNAPDLKPFENASFPGLDNCYEIPDSYESSSRLPTLSFHFAGGVTLPLSQENYLVPVASSLIYLSTTFCFSFQPQPIDRVFSTFGYIQQRRVRFTYDPIESLIGFTPDHC